MVSLPNHTIFVMTGNNVALNGDIPRRAFYVRLDAEQARPDQRSGFKYPDDELVQHVKRQRGMLVACCLTMIRAWAEAGAPQADVPTFGNYTRWAKTIGSILAFAGIDSFLANRDARPTEDEVVWDSFLTALAVRFESNSPSIQERFTAGEIAELLTIEASGLTEAAPSELIEAARKNGLPDPQRVGKILASKAETRFGDFDLHLVRAGTHRQTKSILWRVSGRVAEALAAVKRTPGTDPGKCGGAN